MSYRVEKQQNESILKTGNKRKKYLISAVCKKHNLQEFSIVCALFRYYPDWKPGPSFVTSKLTNIVRAAQKLERYQAAGKHFVIVRDPKDQNVICGVEYMHDAEIAELTRAIKATGSSWRISIEDHSSLQLRLYFLNYNESRIDPQFKSCETKYTTGMANRNPEKFWGANKRRVRVETEESEEME